MSKSRTLLNRLLGVMESETVRLEKAAEEAAAKNEYITKAEREALGEYMTVLRHLVGKDLGDGEDADIAEKTEEELLAEIGKYANESGTVDSGSPRRKSKAAPDDI